MNFLSHFNIEGYTLTNNWNTVYRVKTLNIVGLLGISKEATLGCSVYYKNKSL